MYNTNNQHLLRPPHSIDSLPMQIYYTNRSQSIIWILIAPLSSHQQKHPDFPKKPLTPYFRFFMEKRAKYAKLHPEMSNLDLTKILSKKYRELPEKKKVGWYKDPEIVWFGQLLFNFFESYVLMCVFFVFPIAEEICGRLCEGQRVVWAEHVQVQVKPQRSGGGLYTMPWV